MATGKLGTKQDMDSRTVAETTAGKIAGIRADGVLRFLGVPYGATTAGANRFRPPQPVTPWGGVREAVELGPRAPQFAKDPDPAVPMDEDCLVLNVWTPSLSGNRPVLVWIHGGGFFAGSGYTEWTDGAALARYGDAVVISVNHRLGLLGFLYLNEVGGDEWGSTANAGMLDLVAALEWVQSNVAAFGGDPDAVTIFGHSGGGGKVATLLAMPAAQGLFRAACMHGGPPFGLKESARATLTARAVLAELGLGRAGAADLQALPVQRLLDLQSALGAGAYPSAEGMRFAPVAGTPSLPAFPAEALAAGFSEPVPLLTGTALDEMRYAMFLNPAWQDKDYDLDEDGLVARIAPGVDNPEQVLPLLDRYRDMTPARGKSRLDLMFDILSDQFRIRTQRLAAAKLAYGTGQVFSYLCEMNQSSPYGAFHGIEMPLFFRTVGRRPDRPDTPQFRRNAEIMSSALISFARSGNPNEAGGSTVFWPAYTQSGQEQLVIREDAVMGATRPRPERIAAWDGVITTVRTDPWGRAFA